VADCRGYLAWLSNNLFTAEGGQISSDLVNSPTEIGVGPYTIPKDLENLNMSAAKQQYVFEAGTTKFNLLKLLRAYSLDKPILIEGAPGVGKTSIVENLAKQCGKTLVRVNLSE
jgi:midasin